MLFGLFRRHSRDAEHKAYCEIVAQARQPAFYADFHVPDTVDGRFDMIVVHAVLLFRRFAGEGKAVAEFSQAVFDLFFHDMDASLREMGVSDTGVPRKIKVMGEAFYGRADAYAPGLEAQDAALLAEAIGRNVFPDEPNPLAEEALASYMLAADKALAAQNTSELTKGNLSWPDPEIFKPAAAENNG